MSDRKYRQHGYQDSDRDRAAPSSGGKPKPKSSDMTYGPRAIQMAPTHTISRCAQCGVVLQAFVDSAGKCPQCGAALHACKQCTHFDPGSRFECRQPITERVAKKDAANLCAYYTLSTRFERETSTSIAAPAAPRVSSGNGRVEDARRAFENLFKK